MFIKGCENTNNNNFDKEAYREGWKRIFGNKHGDGVSRFPSGKGIYDEKRGVWVDSKAKVEVSDETKTDLQSRVGKQGERYE